MTDQRMAGGCQCGVVRYRLSTQPLALNVCHCNDCQRQSGSAFSMSLIVDPGAFTLTQGKLSTFVTTADSGREKTCAFCANCGVRIYNQTAALMAVKPGTLDDRSRLQATAHYWVSRKQPWLVLADNLPQHDKA